MPSAEIVKRQHLFSFKKLSYISAAETFEQHDHDYSAMMMARYSIVGSHLMDITELQQVLQTLISVPVVSPKRCHTLSNPAHRQDYTVACLNYTLQTMMPLPGWPAMAPNAYDNNNKFNHTLLWGLQKPQRDLYNLSVISRMNIGSKLITASALDSTACCPPWR